MKITTVLIILIINFSAVCCKSFRSGKDSPDAYYINNEKGNDNNSGTGLKPLKTIAELNARLQKKPADVYFEGGQTFNGTLLLKNITGTETKPVTITNRGQERATINGGNNEAIKVENCRNIQVENLNIIGNGRKDGNKTNGFSFVNTVKGKIKNLNARGFQKSGVDLYNCKEIEVIKVQANDNGFSGINVSGDVRSRSRNILIQDCAAENNPGDPTNLENHSGNGILVGVSDSVLIDHCTATNNGWDMPRVGNGPVGIWTWESNRVIIQYCISYRNKTSKNAKDGGGFDLDGGVTNSLVQYCLSYENQGAGYGLFQYGGASNWSGNIIRYCVSINDATTTEGAGGIFIWNGSADSSQLRDCQIYNNVIYNSKVPVVSYENASAHKNFMFCNNIFICTGQVINGNEKGSSFIGNVWWSDGDRLKFTKYGSLSEWALSTGQEMLKGKLAGMQSDPLFKGPMLTGLSDAHKLNTLIGYTLQPGSPLINKGIDIKKFLGLNENITDFYGNPVPLGSGQEPGIYETK